MATAAHKMCYTTIMKLLLGLAVSLFLAVSCLGVPDNLTMVIEEFDGYRDGSCGFYGWHDNIVHIDEDCVLPEVRYQTILYHELCHAHQDFGAEEEFGLDETLRGWGDTNEGQSYAEAIQGRGLLYYPWGRSLIEDFAIACSKYYTDRADAYEFYPVRSAWMDENLAPLPPKIPPIVD